MALYHKATITPSKAEILQTWVPTQPWCPNPDAPIEPIGAYRFDDPEGSVGMEVHLVRNGEAVLHVPLTYRDAPVDGQSLAGEMHHSELGNRWVYDGLTDPQFIVMLAGASLTGQGEALGMVVYGGEWFIAPAAVRIRGGGWGQERVSVDGFEAVDGGGAEEQTFRNSQFELTVHRHLTAGPPPALGLLGSWDDWGSSVVLSEIVEHSA